MEENSSQRVWYSLGLPDTFRKIVWTSVIIVIGISLLDLAGWLFGVPFLKSLLPSWEAMRVITSVCLILSTAALVLVSLNLNKILTKILPGILASFIILVSFITLCDYLNIVETGQESASPFPSSLSFIIAHENRMALLTSFAFFITGIVILLLTVDKKKASDLAHILIFPVILVTYYTIVSYILGVNDATEILSVSVAMNTGIAFLGLCIIVLSLKPGTWLLKAYTSKQIGGVIARRLLPILMTLPVAIGWIRIKGEHFGLFESDQGVIFVAMAYTISFLILIWVTAKSVNNIDSKRRISEEALLESREQLAAVFDGVSETLMLIDISGKILMANSTAIGRFDKENNGFKGKNLFDFVPGSYHQHRKDQIAELIKTRNPLKFQDRFGEQVLDLTFYPISDVNGNVVQIVSFAIDVTDKKRAEESLRASEQRLKFHFENSPLAVVEWDSDYIVINWSIEAVRIFGYEKEEVLGKRIDTLNLIFEDDLPIVGKAMERLSGGKELTVVSENRNYTRKKEIINCIWYNSVLLDENCKMSSVMSLVEDVTEKRRTEQKIIDRTKELELANNQLVELNATKDKFFNIVAHDLKNPFTSLMGSSELLFENIDSMSTENIKKLAAILNDSAKGGYSILQNLLDWSRSQTGMLKITPQKINLKNLVEENISNLQLPATNKQISIINEVKEDIFVISDKNMINTILRNLLSNAIKFTRKGGNVSVKILTDSDKFVVQVKDNGVGIPPDKIGKLFSLETKHTVPGTENEQGTGLGLKLSKEFVEKLGGTIKVVSNENEGSKFSFTIPLNNLSEK